MRLSSSNSLTKNVLLLKLIDGKICLILHIHNSNKNRVCFEKNNANDGHWHQVRARRQEMLCSIRFFAPYMFLYFFGQKISDGGC